MSEDVNARNIKTLHQALNDATSDIRALKERLQRLEANLAVAHAELANAKQLMAHIMGRGMGSTTE